MAGTCNSDHAQLRYNSQTLLRNLLAAILFPKKPEPDATLPIHSSEQVLAHQKFYPFLLIHVHKLHPNLASIFRTVCTGTPFFALLLAAIFQNTKKVWSGG